MNYLLDFYVRAGRVSRKYPFDSKVYDLRDKTAYKGKKGAVVATAYKDEARGTWYVSCATTIGQVKTKESQSVAFGREKEH